MLTREDKRERGKKVHMGSRFNYICVHICIHVTWQQREVYLDGGMNKEEAEKGKEKVLEG